MATRFYLPSTGSAAVAPAYDSEWNVTTDADRLRCLVAKSSSAMTTKTFTGSGASPQHDILARQYVSDQLAAQTISGTVKGQVRAAESNAAIDAQSQLKIRVVSSNGSIVRGTLLDIDTTSHSNEWATSLTNRKFPKAWAGAGAAVSSVAAQAGDRLVIEFGCRLDVSQSFGDSYTLRFGDTGGTDLPEDETATADNVPWIEFSTTLTFVGQVSAVIDAGGDITASALAGPDYDLEASAAFTIPLALTGANGLRSFRVSRGRATNLTRVEAATAEIAALNGNGVLDPANPGALLNLVANPSLETNTTGWAGYWSVVPPLVTRDTTQQRYGAASLKVHQQEAVAVTGVQYVEIPAFPDTTYTWSVWVKVTTGAASRLQWFENDSSHAFLRSGGPVSFTPTGSWQRVSMTVTTGASTAYIVALVLNDEAVGHIFYVDGAQFERGALTDYIDGDQPAGRWEGAAHASPTFGGAPFYGNILPLKELRLSRREEGVTYYRFKGPIERYEPIWEPPFHQTMSIGAADAFETLSNVQIVSEIATMTTGLTGANNDLVFTAREAGGRGDEISVTYVVAGNNTPLTVESLSPLGSEILSNVIGKIALPAFAANQLQTAFSFLEFGWAGKPPASTVPSQPMTIEISGSDIVVNVATSGGGAATSTAAQIKAALEANTDVMALVSIALAPANDGTGTVTAMAKTNLSGGKWVQEMSGDRITRVLDEIDWPADKRAIDPGTFEVIAQGFSESENVSALTHIQDVADSELGYVFLTGDGTFTYHDGGHRSREERSLVSQATFSDDGTGYPFSEIAISLDKERIANDVTVTAGAQGAVAQRVEDVASQAPPPEGYGRRTLSKSTLLANDTDALAVAESILAAYANPKTRFERVSLLDDGTTAGWSAAVLGREIGDLVSIRTTPPLDSDAIPYTINYDCFIESIEDSRTVGTPWQVTFGLTLQAESVSSAPPEPPDLPGGGEGGGPLLDSSGDELVLDSGTAGLLG